MVSLKQNIGAKPPNSMNFTITSRDKEDHHCESKRVEPIYGSLTVIERISMTVRCMDLSIVVLANNLHSLSQKMRPAIADIALFCTLLLSFAYFVIFRTATGIIAYLNFAFELQGPDNEES